MQLQSQFFSLVLLPMICIAFAHAVIPQARPTEFAAFNHKYTAPNNTLQVSPSDPFPISSTSLILHTIKYGREVPYAAFTTTLLIAFDELFQNALIGEITDRQRIPTTISEWHEVGAVLSVQGKGLAFEDLASSLRGLGLWAQRWGFDRRGGVSGIWSVEQIATGKRCDFMIKKEPDLTVI
ncbi:MAG: hypothetical protein LQ346_003883 [Caloplaca aetnensis]|nr:MAG: hypothetical protein LQ346_003883 [Caloplaca aetnensis]